MNSNASALIIPPPGPAPATNDIRDLKPPVDLPDTWAWAGWLSALLLLAALAAWAWRKWRKHPAQPRPVPITPPHVRARQKLQQALALLSQPDQFCTWISDTIRVYLEERFAFRAPDRTTEEFLLELRDTRLLTPNQKQSLGEFLQSCDLVKFAKFEPTELALRDLHDSACRLVEETRFDPLQTPAHLASTATRPFTSPTDEAPKADSPEPDAHVT